MSFEMGTHSAIREYEVLNCPPSAKPHTIPPDLSRFSSDRSILSVGTQAFCTSPYYARIFPQTFKGLIGIALKGSLISQIHLRGIQIAPI